MMAARENDEPAEASTPTELGSVVISPQLISKRNLTVEHGLWTDDQLAERLSKLTHVRLDRERICDLNGLELLTNCTCLYLQHNKIKEIKYLECLKSLEFLSLSFNEIEALSGISKLPPNLLMLDVSDNHIATVDVGELPILLISLNLSRNPYTMEPDYVTRCRVQILSRLNHLRQFDDEDLTDEERKKYFQRAYDGASDDSQSEEEEGKEGEDEDDEYVDVLEEVQSTSADNGSLLGSMLLRSQARMERLHVEHRTRMKDLSVLAADLAESASVTLGTP